MIFLQTIIIVYSDMFLLLLLFCFSTRMRVQCNYY